MEENNNNGGGLSDSIGELLSAVIPLKVKIAIIIGVLIFIFIIIIPVLMISGVFGTNTNQNDNEQLQAQEANSESSESSSDDSLKGTGKIEVVKQGNLTYPKVGNKVRKAFCYPTTNFIKISARFGSSGRKWSKKHTGVDFVGKGGCSVVAVADGVVNYSGYNSSYGYYVIIQHSFVAEKEILVFYTQYCHLKKGSVTVSKKDKVVQGQVLGTQGSTGNVTGPHCHLEFAKHKPSKNHQLYSYTEDPLSNLFSGGVFKNYPAIKQKYWNGSRKFSSNDKTK